MIKKEIRAPGFVVYEDGGYDRELAKDSVGKGWSTLIDAIFDKRDELKIDTKIVQVKEKYGGLRVYTGAFYDDAAYDEFDKFLIEIEKQSYTICEDCGNAGQLREGRWYRTLCDEHATGRKAIQPF
jgi:hypothetical protein